jgi:hypothetical protein
MAAGIGREMKSADAEPWVRRLREVDQHIDDAWRLLGEARESGRFNPRRSRPEGLDDLRQALHVLEQATADTLSMARTMATSAENETIWEDDFRSSWQALLSETAGAVEEHDPGRLRQVRDRLTDLAQELSTDSLSGSAWYEYGGLLVNLRNVVSAMAQLAEWRRGSAHSPRRSVRRPPLRRPAG